MEFKEMVKARQSTRIYSNKEVELDKLKSICENALNAPSSCNSQPWKLHIYPSGAKEIANIRKACQIVNLNKFLDNVNNFIVIEQVKGNKSSSRGAFFTGNDFNSMDIGMLADHICFLALEEGLGTCMIGAFRKFKILKALGLSCRQRVRLVIAIGYPNEKDKIRRKARKNKDNTIVIH